MLRIFCLKSSLTVIAVTVIIIFLGLTVCNERPRPNFRIAAALASTGEGVSEASLEVDDPRFSGIEVAAKEEIDAGNIPGAVVLVGHRGRVVYRRAFGQRWTEPEPQPMTVDTIFDIASLTKVVATTTAIMQLWERGLLNINAYVTKYWPDFGQNGKDRVKVRQLLAHTSGLREGINPSLPWSDYQGALQTIAVDRLYRAPGTYKYSDVDFIVLGEIVQRVSHQDLQVYCTEKIFKPLKMKQTSFNPPGTWRARIAPCIGEQHDLKWGEVQDPDANRLGGVAGNSGVFSTADDLAVFAQMLLDGGKSGGERILSPGAVAAMTKPQRDTGFQRGLGWDIQSYYSKEFIASFPEGSYGHTGYTGTSIWVDPSSKTYLIILTNRLYPKRGDARPLRAKIAEAVAEALNIEAKTGVSGVNVSGLNVIRGRSGRSSRQ